MATEDDANAVDDERREENVKRRHKCEGKKKLMPMRHDNTIFLEKIMLVYCIMMEILMDVEEIICEHIEA